MLAADGGGQISQFYGHWAQNQPDTGNGQCVRSVIRDDRQEWEVTTCEALLPFMCEIQENNQELCVQLFPNFYYDFLLAASGKR